MGNNGKSTGIVNIKGKEYFTVALRVHMFREKHPDYSLTTDLVARDAECVVVKASISDPQGRVIATGHAEEYRASSQINSTSATENCETSAIGRALAAFGIIGTEFASADEVAQAIHQQAAPRGSARAVTEDAFKALPADKQKVIADTATQVKDYLKEDKDFDAFALCEGITEQDEKLGLWYLLNASERSRIKAAKAQELATQA